MMEKAKCPECNVISMKRDIRKHVLRKIIGTEGDEEEKAQLRSELEEYKIKCAKLQLLERTSNKKYEAVVKEMMRLREQLDVAGNGRKQSRY
ncbi:hypothetical protein H4219_003967 [Mycoemilia scoparia]|uniref:Uncharacterized protein n=1 Tax=Mycoemilia scoparia TaxID=417184 RepID=A0A9W8DS60_9FUNG|nr:hypothetical protein H4219_003967 [Mycoemilia scoparia]